MATKIQEEIQLTTCECKRCAHLWPTRLQGRAPIICPRCRSQFWNTDKKYVPKKELARVKDILAKLRVA